MIWVWTSAQTGEFLGLYRENEDLTVDIWNGRDEWVPSPTMTVFELHGVGGSTEFEPLYDYAVGTESTNLSLAAPVGSPIAKSGFSPTFHFSDTPTPKGYVFGWANVAFTPDGKQVHDLQGHAIDVEDLEEMGYGFALRHGTSGDMHRSGPLGDMIESVVFTPEKMEAMGIPPNTLPTAWWVGFKFDPEEADMVYSGKRRMLSIEGSANLEPFTKHAQHDQSTHGNWASRLGEMPGDEMVPGRRMVHLENFGIPVAPYSEFSRAARSLGSSPEVFSQPEEYKRWVEERFVETSLPVSEIHAAQNIVHDEGVAMYAELLDRESEWSFGDPEPWQGQSVAEDVAEAARGYKPRILYDEVSGKHIISDGNHRIAAMKLYGLSFVPVMLDRRSPYA